MVKGNPSTRRRGDTCCVLKGDKQDRKRWNKMTPMKLRKMSYSPKPN